jgi:hypothetical protein
VTYQGTAATTTAAKKKEKKTALLPDSSNLYKELRNILVQLELGSGKEKMKKIKK